MALNDVYLFTEYITTTKNNQKYRKSCILNDLYAFVHHHRSHVLYIWMLNQYLFNEGDYLMVSYNCLGACKVCIYFTPNCVGFTDGIYRNKYVSPPGQIYFECWDERNVYCGPNPFSTNKAPHNGKCKDLFEISASYWQVDHGVDCSGWPNGNYTS